MMSDYDNLLAKLLEQSPSLTREQVEEQIAAKKDKIGAGYLTDKGALFLVAADLGLEISEPLKVEMGIKDIYSGAKEVSLETRVLSMSGAKQFSRKDGSSFYLRTMTVYDSNDTASVKLWDEKANLPAVKELKPGDLIKIIKAYIKSDLNGTPTINVGSGSSIEQADSQSDIPGIDSITKDVAQIEEGQKNLAVSGTVDAGIGCMRFTNSRGNPGTALRTRIKGKDGTVMRAVMWGKDESDIPASILPDAKIRLLGAYAKMGNQGLEIHGNESTIVEIEGSKVAEAISGRIISSRSSDGKRFLLCADSKKNIFNVTDTANSTQGYAEGDIIECMPSKVHGNAVTLDANSYVRKMQDDDGSTPDLAGVRTKIQDVVVDGSYCIESVVLKAPETRDIQTKTGESVVLSEMYVEDDTGQIWVKGWRNLAGVIGDCKAGQIVSITGLNARPAMEGRVDLVVSAFTKVSARG